MRATKARKGSEIVSCSFDVFRLQNMEEDRAQANIAEAVNAELEVPKAEPPKQPSKRFIGRRAAAQRAAKLDSSNSTIEGSDAIQGNILFLE